MRDALGVVVVGCVVGGCSPRGAERVGADAVVAPSAGAARVDHTARDTAALHNVVRVTPKLVSGALPEGDAAFDELRAMGVRTIISVDGARPDVERAGARGMRYVHIPLRYEGYTREQQLEVARAVRDVEGPIYLHCHHGKHRGPAAAASAAVLLGDLTAEEGVVVLRAAGTSPSYAGLYRCVAEAEPAEARVIDSVSGEFVAVARVSGLVEAMVEADHTYEHLKRIKESGWSVPREHPDLVPAAEAGRLADALRIAAEDEACAAKGADMRGMLLAAATNVEALEALIADEAATNAARDEALARVAADCKSCHVRYRD